VRTVHVTDFQRVHKGDLIVELQDDDYRAQVDQASAAVEQPAPLSKTTVASASCRRRG